MIKSNPRVIFFGSKHKAIKNIYNDLVKCDNIDYVTCPWNYREGLGSFLLTKKAMSLPPSVLKIIYYKIFGWSFLKRYSSADKLVFIICAQFPLYEDYIFMNFIHSLRRIYPKSKLSFYYNDTIGQHGDYEHSIIYRMKDTFDIILTYDKKDAIDYNIEYYGSVNSKIVTSDIDVGEYSDFFYVGSNSGRLIEQISVFKVVSDLGFKAVFYILGVDDKDLYIINNTLNGIKNTSNNVYLYKKSKLIVNVFCEYQTVVSYINKSKCLVEIIRNQNNGSSLRLSESVLYKKKLLTNCKDTINYSVYRKSNILIFKSIFELSANEINKLLNVPFEPVYDSFSPLKLVEYILRSI